MPKEMGLRERKKLRARQALERAALDLFISKGFDNTTINEVAAAAEMSPRTFFRYFATKEDVIFGENSRHLQEMLLRLRAVDPDISEYEALKQATIAFAEVLQSEREEMKLRSKVIEGSPNLKLKANPYTSTWATRICEVLSERQGASVDDEERLLLANVALATLSSAGDRWANENGERSLPEVVTGMFQTLEERIC